MEYAALTIGWLVLILGACGTQWASREEAEEINER